jgi:acid phosphatase family membrane protein YuiD
MDYPFILIPLIAGTLTQVVKFTLAVIRHRKVEVRYLFTPGHMPSSHTSFAVSLATLVGYESGIGSIDFAIAVCVAYVVIYDAMNIRIHIGRNGAAVNRIVKDLKLTGYPVLKERVGHLPEEVLIGGLLGFVLTLGLLRWL